MKRLFHGLLCRFVALRRDERGYAVMATLAIFLFLFVLCAADVDSNLEVVDLTMQNM